MDELHTGLPTGRSLCCKNGNRVLANGTSRILVNQMKESDGCYTGNQMGLQQGCEGLLVVEKPIERDVDRLKAIGGLLDT